MQRKGGDTDTKKGGGVGGDMKSYGARWTVCGGTWRGGVDVRGLQETYEPEAESHGLSSSRRFI